MNDRKSSCPLKFGTYINNTFLKNESSPISKRNFTFNDKGRLSIQENFTRGSINKAWDLAKDITSDYVYIDKLVLESVHPLIRNLYNDPSLPFGKLKTIERIPQSSWKNEKIQSLSIKNGEIIDEKVSGLYPEIIARENGGWVIDKGLRKTKNDPCGSNVTKQDRKQACNIITGLLNMQDDRGYNFSSKTKSVFTDDDGKITVKMDLTPIENRLSLLGVESDSFKTYLNLIVPSVTYWIQTSDFNILDKGISKIERESGNAAVGKKSFIENKDDLERWGDNYHGEGKGFLDISFVPNPVVLNDKNRTFLKSDFVKDEKVFNKCGISKSIGLFDQDGNYVKYHNKKVKNVVGKNSMKDLKKWSWGCISSNKIPPIGFAPVVGGQLKRSLFKNRVSDDTFETSVSSVNDAIRDAVVGFWNAMVKSELNRTNDITLSILDQLPSKIIDRLQKTTRLEDVKIIEEVFHSTAREPIVYKNKVKASPYLIPRKERKTRGMNKGLTDLAIKGRIVGIETSLSKLRDNCT